MARVVRIERDGPYKIEPGTYDPAKPLWICGCGMTRNPPFCDGTHKTCKAEAPGKTYRYDEQGNVTELS